MIKFFRHIRQSLIMENNTTKYFKYAIGEIVLVVIGILIALQINNWNEIRKEKLLELNILKSINTDLEGDIKNLEVMMTQEKLFLEGNKSLIDILENKNRAYDESMDTLFGRINRYGVFYPQKSGYESLKSVGIEIIKSDSLRKAIVKLYDFDYGFVEETLDIKKEVYLSTNPIFLKELKSTGGPNNQNNVSYKQPMNFSALKTNNLFINTLTHIYYERINLFEFAYITLDAMKAVNLMLESEIRLKSND